MNNYYITLNDGFTYGPYSGKLQALLAGLNYYGITGRLYDLDLNDLDSVESLVHIAWRNGKTIIVYSEDEYNNYLEQQYIENEIEDCASVDQFISDIKQFIVQSPIY